MTDEHSQPLDYATPDPPARGRIPLTAGFAAAHLAASYVVSAGVLAFDVVFTGRDVRDDPVGTLLAPLVIVAASPLTVPLLLVLAPWGLRYQVARAVYFGVLATTYLWIRWRLRTPRLG